VSIFDVWPLALFVLTGLLGLVVGSFLNVVAYRLPIMIEIDWRQHCAELGEHPTIAPPHAEKAPFSLWRPRSACPSCGATIAAWHNIPILSYLALRGRCARCGAGISPRYPLIEAAAAALSLVVAYRFGASWQTVVALPFSWALLALAVIDIDHKLLPDSITMPLLWGGLLASLLPVAGSPLFADLRSSVLGASAGYLSLWGVYQLFKLVTGKEGMGYGDFKLLAALGAWLGWQLLPLVILLSAGVGAVTGSVMLFAGGKSRETPIPFGPYLAAAGWVALLWGRDLVTLYQRFLY
jgi:leader peptidase (prepilin peptidase)/N-methyltransferase